MKPDGRMAAVKRADDFGQLAHRADFARADVYVSGHGLPAVALVNGFSIQQHDMPRRLQEAAALFRQRHVLVRAPE